MNMKMKEKKFKWIFFDLDGTLADSIPALYQAHQDFLATFGIASDKAEFEQLNGPSLPEIIQFLKAKYKLTPDEDQLVALYRLGDRRAYTQLVKPFNDVEAVLKGLKERKYQLALVTSADPDIAMEFVNQNNFDSYFQQYVFGTEVVKAKPDPAIYALALKKTQAAPDAVVVVEDSYHGVQAAKATGAFVMGLVNNQTKRELLQAGADVTISKLKDILLMV